MKIIHVHCGEETNVRDPRSYKTTELVVEIRPEKLVQPFIHGIPKISAIYVELNLSRRQDSPTESNTEG